MCLLLFSICRSVTWGPCLLLSSFTGCLLLTSWWKQVPWSLMSLSPTSSMECPATQSSVLLRSRPTLLSTLDFSLVSEHARGCVHKVYIVHMIKSTELHECIYVRCIHVLCKENFVSWLQVFMKVSRRLICEATRKPGCEASWANVLRLWGYVNISGVNP